MGHPAETSGPTRGAVQAKAVDALASSANVAKAARTRAGVDRETLRDWLDRDPEFIAHLNRAKHDRADRLRAEVRDLASGGRCHPPGAALQPQRPYLPSASGRPWESSERPTR